MEREIRLDEVTVFGGKLSFLIPHYWEEMDTEQDNVYLYSHAQTDLGCLRVSLNTATAVAVTPTEKLKRIFENRENVCRDEQTGNLVHSYERDCGYRTMRITLFRSLRDSDRPMPCSPSLHPQETQTTRSPYRCSRSRQTKKQAPMGSLDRTPPNSMRCRFSMVDVPKRSSTRTADLLVHNPTLAQLDTVTP